MKSSVVWTLSLWSQFDYEVIIVGPVYVFSSSEKAIEYVEQKYGKQEWEEDWDNDIVVSYLAFVDFIEGYDGVQIDKIDICRQIVDKALVVLKERNNAD